MENKIGSIEIGKFADLVLLDLNKVKNSLHENEESIYSDIVYSSSAENVNDVMVEGEWIVRNSEHIKYDEKELVAQGKTELGNLLKRVK